MKGIVLVRKVDNLGSIFIPKEIRRALNIKEGDLLELHLKEDGEVVLKKCSPLRVLKD